ncbi:MAG: hypothetical protein ACC661_03700 [Verrucomicrobiales bacterium]
MPPQALATGDRRVETMPEGNRKRGTPGRTLAGFVVVVGIATAAAVRDHYVRSDHEQWYFPTALGDMDVFTGLEEIPHGGEMVRFGGRPLLRRKFRPVLREDARMTKAGRDDSGRYFIYRTTPGEGAEPKSSDLNFHLKVGAGAGDESEFLEVGYTER